MLRPSAPDSSEKNTSFGINRRSLLDATLCAGIFISGIVCFETGRKIRDIFEPPQPKAATMVPSQPAIDGNRRDSQEEQKDSLPIEKVNDGESLLNRPLSFTFDNEQKEECSVNFQLLKNEDGLFLEVEGETYLCDQTFMWVEVYKKIETVVIGSNTESNERLVQWGAKTYGTKITPLSDVTSSAQSIKESAEDEILVKTSMGNLTFKKMQKRIDSLAQVTH